jgi:hypothetical protein
MIYICHGYLSFKFRLNEYITMSHHPIICKNCDNHFSGHYCNNCGQKAAIHRIDLKHILHGLIHAFTHMDKGFLYTSRMMLIRPGYTVREYLRGKRVDHANPLTMLLIIGGLCSLIYYHFELKMISSFKIHELDGGLHAIDSKFFALLFIGYSLLFSFLDFILFRFKAYNYMELFTLNVFISNEILLAQLCLVPVWLWGKQLLINDYLRPLVGFLFISYLIYVRYQFFEVKGDKKTEKRLWLEAFIFIILSVGISWKTYYQLFIRVFPQGWFQ